MYERLDDAAREALRLARDEAQRWNHPYVGTEHILIGLAQSSSHAAGIILQQSGVNVDVIRTGMGQFVEPGPTPLWGSKWLTKFILGQSGLQYTPKAKHVVEQALTATAEDGRSTIGTEHLLYGLCRDPDAIAYQILDGHGRGIAVIVERVHEVRRSVRS